MTRGLITALVVATFMMLPAVAAYADGDADCNRFSGLCGVGDSSGGGGGGGRGAAASGQPRLPACGGDWLRDPPDDNPDGWVQIRCQDGSSEAVMWAPNNSFTGVNVEVLARSLLAQVQLEPLDIGMVPRQGRDSMGVVGLPVWMWVDHPSRTTWGPATISAGGMTLTARVRKVVWNMGDGTKLTCGKGTEWTRADGAKESPDCGHVYEKQGEYTITATAFWEADWSGYGESGTIPFTLDSTRRLPIGEYQVIVTGKA